MKKELRKHFAIRPGYDNSICGMWCADPTREISKVTCKNCLRILQPITKNGLSILEDAQYCNSGVPVKESKPTKHIVIAASRIPETIEFYLIQIIDQTCIEDSFGRDSTNFYANDSFALQSVYHPENQIRSENTLYVHGSFKSLSDLKIVIRDDDLYKLKELVRQYNKEFDPRFSPTHCMYQEFFKEHPSFYLLI